MNQRGLKLFSLWLLMGCLAACGGSPAQPTESYDGIWVGSNGEGRVQLTIRQNRIVAFSMQVVVSTSSGTICIAPIPFVPTVDVAIIDRTFEFTISETGGFDTVSATRISGRFESARRLNGEFQSFTLTNVCTVGQVAKPAGTFYANQ